MDFIAFFEYKLYIAKVNNDTTSIDILENIVREYKELKNKEEKQNDRI